ncbi:MAG: cyclase family protein [Phycisphaerae bacterium]
MIHDITPPITASLNVFPGDTPPSREVLLDMSNGDALTLSTLRATVHLGAHADAPSHYGVTGRPIDQQGLDYYIGTCQVIHAPAARATRVEPADLTAPIQAPRVLLATGTYPNPERWNPDFAALSPPLVDHLHDHGVITVGVDTPSVDPADAKVLTTHHRFLTHDMAIIEGLVLTDVPDGLYELIALPLKLAGFDASPVRAILRDRAEV